MSMEMVDGLSTGDIIKHGDIIGARMFSVIHCVLFKVHHFPMGMVIPLAFWEVRTWTRSMNPMKHSIQIIEGY